MEKNEKGSPLRKAGINFWIDALAFLTLLITAVSGMALMRISHGEHDAEVNLLNEQIIWGLSHFEWLHIHNIIGWIFVIIAVVHMVMHRRWVARMCSGLSRSKQA